VDFLELLNAVIKAAKPASFSETPPVTDYDRPLVEYGIDSLDMLMVVVFTCEIFGIPETVGKDIRPRTARDLQQFVEANKTKSPATVDEAMGDVW